MTTRSNPPPTLSHIDDAGRARMVDVGGKATTDRVAIAEGMVRISEELEAAIRDNALKKGDLLRVAELAGVQGAKRTAELVPLCHTLPLDSVRVEAIVEPGLVRLRAEAKCHGRTGVEMEALTAVSVAALTVIDMGKAVDPAMVIDGVRLLEKRGGKHGVWVRDESNAEAHAARQPAPATAPSPGHGGGTRREAP